MGSSNSIPNDLIGTYREHIKENRDEHCSVEFDYKLILKNQEFELTTTKTNNIRREDGGFTFQIDAMSLLMGDVVLDSKDNNLLLFKTKNASSQTGGGMMGIPLPDPESKVDFEMKFNPADSKLAFVSYPKMKFEKLTGNLKKLGKIGKQ